MIIELLNILIYIKRKYKTDQIITIGDFNMSNIAWHFDSDFPGFLLPSEVNLTDYETRFIEICNFHSLIQINHMSNSNNKFLDLVLTTDLLNISVSQPIEYIDRNSRYHIGIHIEISYREESIDINDRRPNSFNICLKDSNVELLNTNFNLLDNQDILELHYSSTLNFVHIIECITNQLYNIQHNNTYNKQKVINVRMSNHPWTNNIKYKLKVKAKSVYTKTPTLENKHQLKICHINLYLIYNRLNANYYDKLFEDNHNNFYNIIKTKRKVSNMSPIKMTYKSINYTGDTKYKYIWEHMQSCFAISTFSFFR